MIHVACNCSRQVKDPPFSAEKVYCLTCDDDHRRPTLLARMSLALSQLILPNPNFDSSLHIRPDGQTTYLVSRRSSSPQPSSVESSAPSLPRTRSTPRATPSSSSAPTWTSSRPSRLTSASRPRPPRRARRPSARSEPSPSTSRPASSVVPSPHLVLLFESADVLVVSRSRRLWAVRSSSLHLLPQPLAANQGLARRGRYTRA